MFSLVVLGTILCGLGFLKIPKHAFQLLRPAFVIPGLVWVSTFFQIQWATLSYYLPHYEYSRIAHGTEAAGFVCACMVMFWLGYLLPVGSFAASYLPEINADLRRLTPETLLKVAFAISACDLAAYYLLDHFYSNSTSVGRIIRATSIVAAALVGVGWGLSAPLSTSRIAYGMLTLVLVSLPSMANFSRATGLPVLMAMLTYTYVSRRFKPTALALACLWVGICAHTGLTGRVIHGHYGGIAKYLDRLGSGAWLNFGEMLQLTNESLDSYTTLCVSIAAIADRNVGQLDQMDWWLNQIPVPRAFGLPDWTLDLTLYLGWAGVWGYPPGIFGDLYCHFQGFGCLFFVAVGVAYKFVDRLAFSDSSRRYSLNWYMLFAFATYYAFVGGLFMTFRAWNAGFFLPLYVLLAAVAAREFLFGTRSPTKRPFVPQSCRVR